MIADESVGMCMNAQSVFLCVSEKTPDGNLRVKLKGRLQGLLRNS